MHITFCGAAHEVTGSCYLIETDKTRILVDCGMFQGSTICQSKNFQPFPFDPKTIDVVFVTHAHLDHTGRLPKLVSAGFHGKIYLTPPTAPLAKLVLEDAYHLMVEGFKRDYRPVLYEEKDLLEAVKHFHTVEYGREIKIGDLSVRFREAGHIFGSAFIQIEELGGPTVVFSGDLGNEHVPILRDTSQLAAADAVIMESTYGDKIHEDESTRSAKLKELLTQTANDKGVLIIPAFAIERTQQLLYEMNYLVEHKLVPTIDIYLDSPMAISATEIIKDFPQYYDEEALKLVSSGDDLFDFSGLHVCRTRDESKEINSAPMPKAIISGAGMMNGGRILHHLVRYLGNPHTTVVIVGYQAQGTLGRHLYEGAKLVHVLNEEVTVRARITSIAAYSAHADQRKLIEWIQGAERLPKHVYCTHGEYAVSQILAERLKAVCGVETSVPAYGETITL